MSLFTERAGRALLVIDVQNDVVADAHDRDTVVGNIRALTQTARAHGVPVVWVQHNDAWMQVGTPDWELVPELERRPSEPLIHKQYRSSFESTELDSVLETLNAGELIVCGAQTNNCVRHTIHAALERGYDVTLVEDAHTTSDFTWDNGVVAAASIIDEQNASLHEYTLPGRFARLSATLEVFDL